MMWWYGNGMGMWGYTLMTISMVLFWGLVILGVIALVRYLGRGEARGQERPIQTRVGVPEQILAQRFAAGEIDEQEYRQRLEVLRDGAHRLTQP